MTVRKSYSQRARQEMRLLIVPGILGFYTHFEVTEVFAFPPGERVRVNIFSILVAQEGLPTVSDKPSYLNPKRRKASIHFRAEAHPSHNMKVVVQIWMPLRGNERVKSPGPFDTRPSYAGSATGAGAALPRIRSEPFSAITMVAE